MKENWGLNTHNQGVAGSCPAGPTEKTKSTFWFEGAFVVYNFEDNN